MSKILVVCPTHRDRRELALLGYDRAHQLYFHDYASDALEELVAEHPPQDAAIADVLVELEGLIAKYRALEIDAVFSSDDYPGSTFACIIAGALGLSAPRAAVNLLCQHKYHARVAQRELVPSATPEFKMISRAAEVGSVPIFIKPVKSFFSVGAHRCDTRAELERQLPHATLPDRFFEPFDALLVKYSKLRPTREHVIAESVLEGAQCTLEGYAWDGKIHVMGVTDSVMFPGTIAFQRFDYPSRLPDGLQEQMSAIAQSVMAGIGFDRGLFNIEFIVDEARGTTAIVEINPRMASQFADLYEKVDGYNSYQLMVDIALGRPPQVLRRRGKHNFAASCVMRSFQNARVERVPGQVDIDRLLRRIPDARVEVLATAGQLLSQQMQDGRSYRYGIVNLGGRDLPDVLAQLQLAEAELPYTFASV